MPSIIIKPRAGGKSAQLVRSVYSKTLKRSITVNVGSLSITADADKLPEGIRLVEGQTLSAEDVDKIRTWLNASGTPAYPEALLKRIEEDVEARLREQLAVERAALPSALSEKEEPHNRLLDALRLYNQASSEAQTAYRALSKGMKISDKTILEYQKTWFSGQDMLSTLTAKPCFYRPGGWSQLRAQVLAGKVYKKPDAD